MNDSLIDKILLGGAVVSVLAAAAFFGVSRIDWAPASVATEPGTPTLTATAVGPDAPGTAEPTPVMGPDGEVVPTSPDEATPDASSEPAPTATTVGQRARISTDYLLLTPEGASDTAIDAEELQPTDEPLPTDEPYFEPTMEVWPTEVLPPPDILEPTLAVDDIEQPTDIPIYDDATATPDEFLQETPTSFGEQPNSLYETPTAEVYATALPTSTPQPTMPPLDVMSGTVSWSGLRAVTKDVLVPSGAQLIVEPGTTLKLSAGVSIYVDGTLRFNGTKAQPVYVTNANGTAQPWGAVYVREDGVLTVNDTFVWNGGAAGTLLSVELGTARIADSEIKNNYGQIRLTDAVFSLQKSTVRDNDLSFGAMVDATYAANGSVLFEYSRIGPNSGGSGTLVAVNQTGAASLLQLDVTETNLVGSSGVNVSLVSKGTLTGAVVCSTFHGGDTAVRVDSTGPSVPGIGMTIRQSVFSGHLAAYGPARVVVSNVGVDARTNWWNAASGPYHPKNNPSGSGEANGVNVTASGWLTERPACAPVP